MKEAHRPSAKDFFARVVELGVGIHRDVSIPGFEGTMKLVSIRRDESEWWRLYVLTPATIAGEKPLVSDISWDTDGNWTGDGAGLLGRTGVSNIFGADVADELKLPDEPPSRRRQKPAKRP